MKRFLPDIVAVLAFVLIAFVYFFPADIEGRILFQHDSVAGVGAGQEATEYLERTGERTRWTNALFGGMPTYQLAPSYDSTKPLQWVERLYQLYLPPYVVLVFIMMVGFYILLRAFKVPVWLSALGGVLWAFSSYFFILISAGHIWKFVTLAYIPPTIAGVVLAYRGKYLGGGLLAALFIALQIQSNHVQMSYYFLFVILFLVVAYFAEALRKRELPRFFKASAVLLLAAVVGVSTNLSNLYHTYQYSKETMRAPSELKQDGAAAAQASGGLDRDYITQWSYGIGETLTLLVPNVKGGASVPLSQSETAMSAANPQYSGLYAQLTQYFGDQPMTSGPVYVGAFVLFLFLLGCFVVKGPVKWALAGATLFSILLSWGKNYMGLTDFFIDYIPMYNKFRAVSSILVIAEFTIPLLAVLCLREILAKPDVLAAKVKPGFRWTFAFVLGGLTGVFFYLLSGRGVEAGPLIGWFALLALCFAAAYWLLANVHGGAVLLSLLLTAGVALVLAVAPGLFFSHYVPAQELAALQQAIPAEQLMPILDNLKEVRQALVTADAWRSFFVVAAGFALLLLYVRGKLRAPYLVGGVLLLCLVDLWTVDKRYLSDDQFVAKTQRTEAFRKTPTDETILQDTALNYRVLNLAGNTFNENNTSYWHKSVGGYHAAKLRRYQEMIDHHILPEMQGLHREMAEKGGLMDSVDTSKFRVLNMLNTKYFIFPTAQPGGTVPILNTHAYGNGWFVNRVEYVDNANQEIDALNTLHPIETAVVDARFREQLGGATQCHKDSASVVRLVSYEPNRLVYSTRSAGDGVAVFSEIYYPGWQATIDGQPVEIARADYILRALKIPAGQHTVEMRFDPQSLHVTEGIAYAALGLLLLGALVFVARLVAKRRSKQ